MSPKHKGTDSYNPFQEGTRMEPNNIEGFELELEINVEELELKVAPGELVWPFSGGGGNPWGGR